jgi:ketol-acid reductoisomerase
MAVFSQPKRITGLYYWWQIKNPFTFWTKSALISNDFSQFHLIFMSKLYYDDDVNGDILQDLQLAVIGYGAQGRAQARMLHESGLNTIVGVRLGGGSDLKAKEDGLVTASIEEAVKIADIVHILIPDEVQQEVYEGQIAPNLKPGATISFSHGFNIVFKRITPPTDSDVIMIAPKAPGTEVYKCYLEGFGVPALAAVKQNPSGKALEKALAMGKAMALSRAGIMECTFEEEAYEDLFGEQAVLCGGVSELVKYGFEVLTEAGYPAELAYFECLHELKLIVDLMYEGGISRMYEVVSNTAEFGGHTRGPRIITPDVKERMKEVLKEVESGQFAEEWMQEAQENKMQNLLAKRAEWEKHQLEIVGKKIRKMFKRS